MIHPSPEEWGRIVRNWGYLQTFYIKTLSFVTIRGYNEFPVNTLDFEVHFLLWENLKGLYGRTGLFNAIIIQHLMGAAEFSKLRKSVKR